MIGRAAEAVRFAEPDRAGEGAGVLAGVGEVRDRVADREVLTVGGGLVDGDLVDARSAAAPSLTTTPWTPASPPTTRRTTGAAVR